MISVINKPTRVTKKSASCIDHIYVNFFFNQNILSGIIKHDVSDHFPIFILDNDTNLSTFPEKTTKKIRIFSDSNISQFKETLSTTDWSPVISLENQNHAYDNFLKMFKNAYDTHFPLKTIEIKRKDFLSPWITKGLKKSSKRKQKLYVKFLKTKSFKAEKKYKTYKNLFEKLKYASKK